MQNEATKTTDNVTWLCPDCKSVTVDMADVMALQAAYDALKAENEQLSAILENTQKQRNDAYDARKAAQERIAEIELDNENWQQVHRRMEQDADTARRLIITRDERIAELEAAQQWQQLVADEVHIQEAIGKTIRIENEGRWIGIENAHHNIGAWLDDLGCAIFRKVQP